MQEYCGSSPSARARQTRPPVNTLHVAAPRATKRKYRFRATSLQPYWCPESTLTLVGGRLDGRSKKCLPLSYSPKKFTRKSKTIPQRSPNAVSAAKNVAFENRHSFNPCSCSCKHQNGGARELPARKQMSRDASGRMSVVLHWTVGGKRVPTLQA